MRESTLAKFLSGDVDAAALRHDLADVVGTNTLQSSENLIMDLSFDFEMRKEHLIRLCNTFLENAIDCDDLQATVFFLQGADHFVWDTDLKEGELVAEVISDWSAPEINYPLTRENVSRYLGGLLDGLYPFASTRGRAR